MRILLVSLLLLALEAAAAFLSLDLIFRSICVEPAGLKVRLSRSGWLYTLLAVVFAGLGGWAGWRFLGPRALAAMPLYLLPWWLLWRFGLRKQFTFLFESTKHAKEPDS